MPTISSDTDTDTDIFEYVNEETISVRRLDPGDGEKFKAAISEKAYRRFQAERYILVAPNFGASYSEIDLLDVLFYAKNNLPELWDQVTKEI